MNNDMPKIEVSDLKLRFIRDVLGRDVRYTIPDWNIIDYLADAGIEWESDHSTVLIEIGKKARVQTFKCRFNERGFWYSADQLPEWGSSPIALMLAVFNAFTGRTHVLKER